MRAFKFGRYALPFSLAASLLCACGGGAPVPVAAGDELNGATGLKHHQIFGYTGAEQKFVVPAGVKRLTVSAHGGKSGGYSIYNAPVGFPGRVYAVILVQPGETLYVFVGGGAQYGAGGFNGGGAGGSGSNGGRGGGGGGASDVRRGGDALKDRIIVAAGAGGTGICAIRCYGAGGNGGGLDGQGGDGGGSGTRGGGGGGGGTQQQGGSGGTGGVGQRKGQDGQPGGNGKLGVGGNGGNGGPASGSSSGCAGGGAGGGYYGGGGGGGSAGGYSSGNSCEGGGGGGGSSYVEPGAITSHMWSGWRTKGDGRVIFSWN